MSWGSEYDASVNPAPLTHLDRLFKMLDHQASSITADQKTSILSLLLGISPEEREEWIGWILVRVLSRDN